MVVFIMVKDKKTSRVAKKITRDISIPHAGIGKELHEHAKKVYKKLAPKAIEAAHKIASKAVDEGTGYVANQAKANTPSAVHGAIDKARDYVSKGLKKVAKIRG